MAFKASKKRERKPREPIAQGKQLIASAPVRNWYEAQLKALCKSMLEDYRAEIVGALDAPPVESVFGVGDASANETFKRKLERLQKKWSRIFTEHATKTAKQFVAKVDQHSKATVTSSLQTAGLEQPRMAYTEAVNNTLESSVTFNSTLITGLQEEAHTKLQNAIMLSLTSPNPEEQGQPGIMKALNDVAGITGRRAELIARDQTSKVYSSLNMQRMQENGVEKFRWVHSSAGKIPRPSHVARDMEIFEIDDPRLWEGPKSDQGPPGWAINCRCRAIPVIDI